MWKTYLENMSSSNRLTIIRHLTPRQGCGSEVPRDLLHLIYRLDSPVERHGPPDLIPPLVPGVHLTEVGPLLGQPADHVFGEASAVVSEDQVVRVVVDPVLGELVDLLPALVRPAHALTAVVAGARPGDLAPSLDDDVLVLEGVPSLDLVPGVPHLDCPVLDHAHSLQMIIALITN